MKFMIMDNIKEMNNIPTPFNCCGLFDSLYENDAIAAPMRPRLPEITRKNN